MRKYIEILSVFTVGALLYCIIEILWRGYTHWTMGIAGGICFTAVYLIKKTCPNVPCFTRYAAGAAIICTVEYLTGFIVNVILDWEVWDYSERAFNIYGQICPLYTLFWFLICIPGDALAGYIIKAFSLFGNDKNTENYLSESDCYENRQ